MTFDEFNAKLGLELSEATFSDLRAFADLVAKWNPKINLVSKPSLAEIWSRHILDSAQLFRFGRGDLWADFGSGGGFPGIVLAILAKELRPSRMTVLVESDQRKATFLREAARISGANVKVLSQRVEAADPLRASTVSARALTALPQLLAWTSPHLASDGCAVFPKGASFEAEIASARLEWDFRLEVHPSLTDGEARVLELTDIARHS